MVYQMFKVNTPNNVYFKICSGTSLSHFVRPVSYVTTFLQQDGIKSNLQSSHLDESFKLHVNDDDSG